MNANSFNFILDDLGSGVHMVEVQAQIKSASSSQNGTAEARASIGKGSVTIEQVRMFKDDPIEFD